MPWKMDRRGWQLPLPNVSPSPWDPGRMDFLSRTAPAATLTGSTGSMCKRKSWGSSGLCRSPTWVFSHRKKASNDVTCMKDDKRPPIFYTHYGSPWDDCTYIYLHENHKYLPFHVGKYTHNRPMEILWVLRAFFMVSSMDIRQSPEASPW